MMQGNIKLYHNVIVYQLCYQCRVDGSIRIFHNREVCSALSLKTELLAADILIYIDSPSFPSSVCITYIKTML